MEKKYVETKTFRALSKNKFMKKGRNHIDIILTNVPYY